MLFLLLFISSNRSFMVLVFVSSPQNKNSVISYSLSSRSKPSEHKLRYFWWNPRAFWRFIVNNATDTFKAQKYVVEMVYVTSMVQP